MRASLSKKKLTEIDTQLSTFAVSPYVAIVVGVKKAARGLPQLLRIVVGVVDSSSQEFRPRLLNEVERFLSSDYERLFVNVG